MNTQNDTSIETDPIRANDVLMHHLTAFGNNDLDEILIDYTDQSEVITSEGKLTGLASIRLFFEEFFAVIPMGSHFELKQKIITGNFAYIVWSSESENFSIGMGTDTFFFEGGKIRLHTVADDRVKK